MSKFVWIYALLLSVICYGCLTIGPTIKDVVIKDGRFQAAYVKNVAISSANLFVFVDSIYEKGFKKTSDLYVAEETKLSKSKQPENFQFHWDINIFKTYCSAKNGKLYSWVNGSYVPDFFYVCEIDNSISAVMDIRTFGRQSDVFPYEHSIEYRTPESFQEFIRKANAESYVSENKQIAIKDVGNIQGGGKRYDMKIRLANDTKVPYDINVLNSKIVVKGVEYSMDFNFWKRKGPIEWDEYNGTFIDGSNMSRLKLNPGQSFYGKTSTAVYGLANNDFSDTSFLFDHIKLANFKKVRDYDLYKKEL